MPYSPKAKVPIAAKSILIRLVSFDQNTSCLRELPHVFLPSCAGSFRNQRTTSSDPTKTYCPVNTCTTNIPISSYYSCIQLPRVNLLICTKIILPNYYSLCPTPPSPKLDRHRSLDCL
nr:MAG TPA: hypothetical protein [Caudoviricetes sp.]